MKSKIRTWSMLGGAGAFALALAFVIPEFALGADHTDSPAAAADPLSDLNDLYAWMSPEATNLNLAMTVGGLSAPTAYGTAVTYVFHINRGTNPIDPTTQNEVAEVRCQFADADTYECWLIDLSDDSVLSYVTGDTDAVDVESAEGMQVFAGLRNDAFVFEFEGFTDAVNAARTAAPDLPASAFDANGCILLEGSAFDNNVGTQSAENAVVDLLLSSPDPADPTARIAADDTFAGLNSQTIVVVLPKALIPGATDPDIIGVWASTNMAPGA